MHNEGQEECRKENITRQKWADNRRNRWLWLIHPLQNVTQHNNII